MAGVYRSTGQPQRALALYEEALPLRRAVGDRAGEATTLTNMAAVYDATGQPQRALALYEEALPLRRAVGDRAGEANTLSLLAVLLYQNLNRPAEAVQHLQQAIAVLEATGLDRAASGTTIERMRQVLTMMQRGAPLGGGGGPSVSADVMQAIQAFLSAGDWAATRQIVEAQQALLFDPQVEAIFEQNIDHVRSQGNEQAVRMLTLHLDVLRACKQQGIAATFAQLEQPPDLPFDPEIITHSIAALRGGPQEKMTHAQYLTSLAGQSDDAQLQALVKTIQTALFGGNLHSLGSDLAGVYAQAWAAIVAGIQQGDNQAPNQGAQGAFQGPMTFNQPRTTFNEQGQQVQGNQYNAARDLIQAGRDVTQVGGDYVGGDKISGDINVRDVSGSGIAIGHKAQPQSQQGGDAEAFARAFAQVYQAINTRPDDPDVGRDEITEAVRSIEEEARKGDQANERKLTRWLRTLAGMAEDIFDVTVAALTGPQAAVATVARKVAAKAKQEREQG
jgi:hypothetical protein